MPRFMLPTPAHVRAAAPAAVLLALALGATACGQGTTSSGSSTSDASSKNITVTLTDNGCKPEPATAPAGPVTFTVKNESATSITETELQKDKHLLAEKENLTPGLSGDFSLKLTNGTYEVYCPGAKQERFPFTVKGASTAATQSPELKKAIASYRSYVIVQSKDLTARTTRFTKAIKAGNIENAKALYPTTRVPYERIEPVAESFGDLDPAIDARVNDVEDTAKWTGFHRLERALWQDKSLKGMTPIATKLQSDVDKLESLVTAPSLDYQPAQLANGAVGLLDEVAKSKLPGEEDRYSHTDLYDFQANVDGSKKAFDLLAPTLKKTDPKLASTISARFTAVDTALDPHRNGSGFVTYTTKSVPEPERRALATELNALAEPLSQVAAKVAKAN